MTIEPVLAPRTDNHTVTRCPACHARIDLADLLAPLLAGAAPGSVHVMPIVVNITADKVKAVSKIADGVEFDADRWQLRVNAVTYALTLHEAQLLTYFMSHPRSTLSREAILDAVWGYDVEANDREVDNYVYRLRRLFAGRLDGKDTIVTVRGRGYRFEPNVEEVRPSFDEASIVAADNGRDGKRTAHGHVRGRDSTSEKERP